MERTGSESCPMRGFDIRLMNLHFLLPELISKVGVELTEIGCEDGRWIELAQNLVSWRALVSATLNLRILVPES